MPLRRLRRSIQFANGVRRGHARGISLAIACANEGVDGRGRASRGREGVLHVSAPFAVDDVLASRCCPSTRISRKFGPTSILLLSPRAHDQRTDLAWAPTHTVACVEIKLDQLTPELADRLKSLRHLRCIVLNMPAGRRPKIRPKASGWPNWKPNSLGSSTRRTIRWVFKGEDET